MTSFMKLMPKMGSSPKRAGTEKVKQALVEKFGRKDFPEDKVRRTLEAKLDQQELLISLKKINCLYKRAKLNKKTKFNRLKNQLRDHKRLVQIFL